MPADNTAWIFIYALGRQVIQSWISIKLLLMTGMMGLIIYSSSCFLICLSCLVSRCMFWSSLMFALRSTNLL